MKNIKFRAWDKIEKEFTTAFSINYKGEIAFQPKHIDKAYMTDSIVLMQYTGLKDKNGKEIYEGDIVSVFPNDGEGLEEKINCFVRWWDEGCCFGLYDIKSLPKNEMWTYGFDEYLLVIGNIYENKEFLK